MFAGGIYSTRYLKMAEESHSNRSKINKINFGDAEKRTVDMKKIFGLMLVLIASLPVTACVAVGYSSGRGWFIWPGGLLLGLVLLVLILWILRSR